MIFFGSDSSAHRGYCRKCSQEELIGDETKLCENCFLSLPVLTFGASAWLILVPIGMVLLALVTARFYVIREIWACAGGFAVLGVWMFLADKVHQWLHQRFRDNWATTAGSLIASACLMMLMVVWLAIITTHPN